MTSSVFSLVQAWGWGLFERSPTCSPLSRPSRNLAPSQSQAVFPELLPGSGWRSRYRPLLPGLGMLETKVTMMSNICCLFQTGWGATPTSSDVIPMLTPKTSALPSLSTHKSPWPPLHKSHGNRGTNSLPVVFLTVSLTLSLASALALPPTLKLLGDFSPGNCSRTALLGRWACPLLPSLWGLSVKLVSGCLWHLPSYSFLCSLGRVHH